MSHTATAISGDHFGAVALPPMATPASGRRWRLREADARTATAIVAATGCEPVLARILAARGVVASQAARHLEPSLKEMLPDPLTMADMERAANRIAEAILNGEPCGVFGDYDVDGTCGSAILKGFFSAVGAPLDVYLPDRMLEGYGPTVEAFRTLKENGASLVMTVDCGAAAHQAIDAAAGEGLDIVVLDHHQMDGPPPAGAFATVNPQRADDMSGLEALSAAGVAFMTVVAVNRRLRERGYYGNRAEPELLKFLDLVALGLVCDVMPMTGLSRALTAKGLKVLDAGGNKGLAELRRHAGSKGVATVYDLGFILGPRINAAGRIGHARLAFELLTTDDAEKRSRLAERLHVMNAERQAIEKDVQESAVAAVTREGLGQRAVIVAASEGWHQGVVGIVAGRIKDMFDRPAIVISVDGGVGKGSARSVSGVDIGAAIRAARAEGLLIAGGGHAMAAGLTIDMVRLSAFRDFLDEHCRAAVEASLRNRTREIDAVVAPTAVSGAFVSMIETAAPFGPQNPEPVFVLASMRVADARVVGAAHLACDLIGPGGERVRAIAFRAAGEPLGDLLSAGRRLHVAGRVKHDGYRGVAAAQFQIVDAAAAAG